MIYHDVGLTKAEGARLRRVIKDMLENDATELEELNRISPPTYGERRKELATRRKFITKPNLLRIFALRGLEDMEQGGNEEEIIDLMARFGRAKGRPNGRK